ncbi:MAG: hypothetical protein ACM3S2_02625 [Ignavibacteriales bacterium]
MNKIIVHIGLLVFFISVIFFGQKGMAFQDILIRSLVLFVASTIMMSLIYLVFVRSINKASVSKRNSFSDNIGRE